MMRAVFLALCFLAAGASGSNENPYEPLFRGARAFFEGASAVRKIDIPKSKVTMAGRCFSRYSYVSTKYKAPVPTTFTMLRVVKPVEDPVLGISQEYSYVEVSNGPTSDDLGSGELGYHYSSAGKHTYIKDYLLRRREKDGKTYWVSWSYVRNRHVDETFCYFEQSQPFPALDDANAEETIMESEAQSPPFND